MRSHWHLLQMNHFNDMSQVRRRKGCKQNHEQQVGAEGGGMRMGSKPPGTTDDEPTQRTRPGKQVRGRPTVVRPRGGHKGELRGGGGGAGRPGCKGGPPATARGSPACTGGSAAQAQIFLLE
jgi:hypothetical protein